MSITRHVQDGRRAAEALMTTTVTVTTPGEQTWNPDTMQYEDGPPVVHYTGKARIRQRSGAVREAEAAGQYIAVQELVLSVPFAGTDTITGSQTVTVTANPNDPTLVGKTFTIQGPVGQTDATARRFTIERTS